MMDFKNMQGFYEFLKVDKNIKEKHIIMILMDGKWQTTCIMWFWCNLKCSLEVSFHWVELWWGNHFLWLELNVCSLLCTIKNWMRVPIFLNLPRFIKGDGGGALLANHCVDCLSIFGGLSNGDLASKLIYFGPNYITIFQDLKIDVIGENTLRCNSFKHIWKSILA